MARRRRSQGMEIELRQAYGLVDKITSIFSFSAIIAYILDFRKPFTGVSLSPLTLQAVQEIALNFLDLIQASAWPLCLALVTLIWLLRYKTANRNELEIIVGCFSRLVPLPEWNALHGSKIVRWLARGLILIFLLLAALVNQIELYAIVVYLWAIGDLLGNASIQRNIMLLFRDKRYDPPPDDPTRDLILRRRAVAESYWIGRPQLVRITIMLAVVSCAIMLTGSILTAELPHKREIAYVIIMGAILVNTTIMAAWRQSRDADLANINEDERALLRARASQ